MSKFVGFTFLKSKLSYLVIPHQFLLVGTYVCLTKSLTQCTFMHFLLLRIKKTFIIRISEKLAINKNQIHLMLGVVMACENSCDL